MKHIKIFIFLVFLLQLTKADTLSIIGRQAPVFRLTNQNVEGGSSFTIGEWYSPDSSNAVIVTFFATWCRPCRNELPYLQKAADSLAASGLRLVAVCVDSVYGTKQKQMVIQTKLTCPVVHDKYGIVARRHNCQKVLPYTVFIDRQGIIRAVSTGFDDKKKNQVTKYIKMVLEK